MIGQNYRMTELSAAIGSSQLAKVEEAVGRRQQLGEYLSEKLSGLEGLTSPFVRENCRHVYYVWALKFDESRVGVSRERFSAALSAEGFPHFSGYVEPLYMLPTFQNRLAIGRDGWPFTLTEREYKKGLCPVVEQMYSKELLCFETCAHEIDDDGKSRLVEAVHKVYDNRHLIP